MIIRSEKREELAAALEARDAPAGRSLGTDAWRRLKRNRAAVVSMFVLSALVLLSLLGPFVLPHDYETPDWAAFRAPPDIESGHYFGTDQNGRDVLARTLYGTRISLLVAFVATLVSVVQASCTCSSQSA
jgi:oligopeptide transport system permease protein